MGKLRDAMVSDLTLRGYRPDTIRSYTNRVRQFAKYFMRSPDEMGEREIRTFLVYLAQVRKLSPAYRKLFTAAIKFLYRVTLNRPDVVEAIPYPKIPKPLPDILTKAEVLAILEAVKSIKYRMVIATAYAAGLRISEACALHCRGDIDSQRMLIHIRQGKGGKDRYVALSPSLLTLLREYFRQARPSGPYLFPGQDPDRALRPKSVYKVFRRALKKTGITKHVTIHSLRHAYAAHLLEEHVDIRVIQALLGHSSIRATCRYTHVSGQLIARTHSPFDSLDIEKIRPGA